MNILPKYAGLALESSQEASAKEIPGLTYLPKYLNLDEQTELLDNVKQQTWSIVTNRRIQLYGYKYEYKNGLLVSSSYLGTLPNWLNNITSRLSRESIATTVFDQVIVNEYQPGQGIAGHIDSAHCFGNTIASLSLGSSCVMEFTHSQTQEKADIKLEPGGLLVLQGEARYLWKHGIAACKFDNYLGNKFARQERISLTFREVLFPYK
ncbi:MAG: alpha-ketoglutarate-dependent dioxygenase AlkB [Coleofasciculaceae cyanobacterium]